MNDAKHAIARAYEEGRTRRENKRKMIPAAPAYLKERVENEEGLPVVEIHQRSRRQEDEIRAAVLERVVGGEMPKELYYDVMEMIIATWDDERKRGAESRSGGGGAKRCE